MTATDRPMGHRPHRSNRFNRRAAGAAAAVALVCVLAVGAALVLMRGAQGQSLVADLSSHLIRVSADFTGAEVVLFGAVDSPGDVAVIVQGPPQDVVVRRKERRLGVWMNTQSMAFDDVPSFYLFASNRPLADIADVPVLERHGVGLDHLRLRPAEAELEGSLQHTVFRRALIRNKQSLEIYSRAPQHVAFLGERLFRTTISFPANVPTGIYQINVLLFQDGEVVSAQTTPLAVNKVGFGNLVFAFSRQYAAAYGLAAIAVALFAGWSAGMVFRRR